MRVEVTLQAMRINAFMEREGRLPTTLEEAGNAFAEVRYERDDGQRYRLALDQGDLHVEYVSGQSLEAFLGDARRIILEER